MKFDCVKNSLDCLLTLFTQFVSLFTDYEYQSTGIICFSVIVPGRNVHVALVDFSKYLSSE